jgi:hypothetical protein
VLAQNAGVWSAGINQRPQIGSGDMTAPVLPGTKANVKNNTQAIIAASHIRRWLSGCTRWRSVLRSATIFNRLH